MKKLLLFGIVACIASYAVAAKDGKDGKYAASEQHKVQHLRDCVQGCVEHLGTNAKKTKDERHDEVQQCIQQCKEPGK